MVKNGSDAGAMLIFKQGYPNKIRISFFDVRKEGRNEIFRSCKTITRR